MYKKKGRGAPLNLLNSENNGAPKARLSSPAILTTGDEKHRKSLSDITNRSVLVPSPYGRKFAITIRMGSLSVDRESVVACAPTSEEFCVTLEVGSGKYCENHCHCYFKFINRFCFMTLLAHFQKVFIDYPFSFHIETIKDLRSYLRYITKEDISPYHSGVNENHFSFNYHCHKYLSSMSVWDPSHWFVVQHRNCYKFLEQLYYSISNNYAPITSYIWPWVGFDVDWFYKLEAWYVNFVSLKFYHKKKHCYLYGTSNVGKSSAVKLLISCLFDRVYYAADSYPFGGFNSKIHKAVIFEEFSYKKYDMSIINRCLEGSSFYCNQKYLVERVEVCQVPVIFISNYEPPDIESFLNRVVVISAYSSVQFSDPIIEEVDSIIDVGGIDNGVLSQEEEL